MRAAAIRCAMAIALVAAGTAGCSFNAHHDQGPLGDDALVQSFPRLPVGSTVTFGLVELQNKGDDTAVIDSVAAVQTDPGLQVLGIMAAGRGRRWATQDVVPGFPPQNAKSFGQLMQIPGAAVPPGLLGTELLIGLRVTRIGVQSLNDLDVAYHVGTHHYVARIRYSFVNCGQGGSVPACRRYWQQTHGRTA